jgi:hypothetical protein
MKRIGFLTWVLTIACILHASSARSDELCPALDPKPAPVSTGACPSDMIEVEGDFCPELEQKCIRRPQEMSYRCLEYEKPSGECKQPTQKKHYCMDTYEWPNKVGEQPVVMQDWFQARDACGAIGKRLCTEDEWTLACEGPEHLPYPYGYERDATACNIDQSHDLINEKALRSPALRGAEVARLWKGEPSGARERCVSPFGVHDMTGNVDEWTLNETGKPHRSALKGGYWSWVRGRCRPVTPGHEEDFKYYNIGWRCCANTNTVTATTEALIAKAGPMPALTSNPWVPSPKGARLTIAAAAPPPKPPPPPVAPKPPPPVVAAAPPPPPPPPPPPVASVTEAAKPAPPPFKIMTYVGSTTKGGIGIPFSARGHRVFVDGVNMGPDPRMIVVDCGHRTVKIGHDGRAQAIDVPCGARVEAAFP